MRALSHSAALLDLVVRPAGKGRVFVPRWVFAGVLAMAAGCSAPDADPLGTSRQALFANDKAAYDYFLGKGLTNFQAAGVVGNLDQESGVDPTIHQNNGGVGRGIAQWSTGARWDTTNNDNVLQYATAHGQSATSLGLQLDFMWYELTTFSQYGLAELKASTNITDATTAVEDRFEGCVYANFPECALPSRVNFAKGIFNAYGADTGPGGQGGGGAGGAGAGGASGAAGAAGSAGTGGTSISGSAGSGGATVGGSAGSSSAGVSGSGPSNAGSSGSPTGAGGSSIAGTTSAGGSPSVAGSSSVAGSPGAAGSTTFPGPSSATNDSGCAFSRPSKTRSTTDSALCMLGALLASTLTLRVRRKRGRARS